MATVKTETTLEIDTYFVDGDTRRISIPDPIADNSALETAVGNLNIFLQANNAIIGDKTGATFGRITKATRARKITTDFDVKS